MVWPIVKAESGCLALAIALSRLLLEAGAVPARDGQVCQHMDLAEVPFEATQTAFLETELVLVQSKGVLSPLGHMAGLSRAPSEGACHWHDQ